MNLTWADTASPTRSVTQGTLSRTATQILGSPTNKRAVLQPPARTKATNALSRASSNQRSGTRVGGGFFRLMTSMSSKSLGAAKEIALPADPVPFAASFADPEDTQEVANSADESKEECVPQPPEPPLPRRVMLTMESHAAAILQFLRIRDIATFHFASKCHFEMCRGKASGKLLVPVLTFDWAYTGKIDTASVHTIVADDARIATLEQNENFSKFLHCCTGLQHILCSKNIMLNVKLLGEALRHRTSLVTVDLAGNDFARKGSDPEPLFLALPARLQLLDLSYNLLEDRHVYKLTEALEQTGLGTLEELLLRSNALGNGACFALGGLLRCPAGMVLRRLDLRTNRVGSEGACGLLRAVGQHRHIRSLRLGYNAGNKQQDLATAQQCALLLRGKGGPAGWLQRLDLSNVRIGDEGAFKLGFALAQNKTLKLLDLAFNAIAAMGAQALAAGLCQNEVLEILDLRDNEVGDEGATALAAALSTTQTLRQLLLGRNEVGDKGAKALVAAFKLNNITRVDFSGNEVHFDYKVKFMRRHNAW